MVVVVMTGSTVVLAQRIEHGVVGSGYLMDDAFLHKGLQGTVYRYPVELLPGFLFDIGMPQRPFTSQK